MSTSTTDFLAPPLSPQLAQFLVQVMIIIVFVRVLGRAFRPLKMPMVIGEIVAGVVIGPSGLGNIPQFTEKVFSNNSLTYLALFADVGLIFFLFFLGLEVDTKLLRKNWQVSVPTALGAIFLPIGCGMGLSFWYYPIDQDIKSSQFAFMLFFGTAISFSAFPVLCRILVSAKMLTSELGIQALAVAAMDDVIGWCTLAFVLGIATNNGALNGLWVILTTAGYIVFMVYPARIALKRIHDWFVERNDPSNRNFVAFLFILLSLSSWFTDILGIEAFFGAFVMGLIVPKNEILIADIAPKIELVVVEVLLPLYFANSGLKTNIIQLNTGHLWLMTVILCAVSFIAKTLPATAIFHVLSRGTSTFKRSLTIGILLDTRGLVALIVINIGYSLHFIGQNVFTMLVIMCLVTTVITPPALYFLYGKEYLQERKAQELRQSAVSDLEHGIKPEIANHLQPILAHSESEAWTTVPNNDANAQLSRAMLSPHLQTKSRWHIGLIAATHGFTDEHIELADSYQDDPVLISNPQTRSCSPYHMPIQANDFDTVRNSPKAKLEAADEH